MKKKGFTLIELLAVIVILAVIALITTPIILNMISTAKKGAAKSSALEYIDAVEKEAMMNQLDPLKEKIKDGTYFVEDLKASYKGVGPDEGLVIIKNGKVEEAKLCINKYSVYYKGSKAEITTNNYCSEEFTITLNIGDNKKEQTIKKVTETTFDINGIDISNKTNMSCNNGSISSIENNTFKVSNIFGDTTCYINDSLEETVSNLDNTNTNIIMLKDEQFKNEIKINSNNDVVLDLNGKAIGPYRIANYGDLEIDDSVGTGTLIGTGQALSNAGTGTLIVNGGHYERTAGTGTTIYEEGTGTLIINDGNFINSSTGSAVQNRLHDSEKKGNIIINGGEFTSTGSTIRNNKGTMEISNATVKNLSTEPNSAICNDSILIINDGTYVEGPFAVGCHAEDDSLTTINGGKIVGTLKNAIQANDGYKSRININNGTIIGNEIALRYYGISEVNINGGYFISIKGSTILNSNQGTININQTKTPIYMTSQSKEWKPVIGNGSPGKIIISGNSADNCTNNMNDLKSGLCVYAEGDKNYEANTSNTAVANTGDGTININGGTYFGGFMTISNHYAGTINIKTGNIKSGNYAIYNLREATTNICGGNIESKKHDIWAASNTTTGKINYSSSVIFTNGTNTPAIGGVTTNIIGNYQGTCTNK